MWWVTYVECTREGLEADRKTCCLNITWLHSITPSLSLYIDLKDDDWMPGKHFCDSKTWLASIFVHKSGKTSKMNCHVNFEGSTQNEVLLAKCALFVCAFTPPNMI